MYSFYCSRDCHHLKLQSTSEDFWCFSSFTQSTMVLQTWFKWWTRSSHSKFYNVMLYNNQIQVIFYCKGLGGRCIPLTVRGLVLFLVFAYCKEFSLPWLMKVFFYKLRNKKEIVVAENFLSTSWGLQPIF